MALRVAAVTGETALTIRPAGAGANSRTFRVTTPTRILAVKHYRQRAGDSRDRLDVEWRALTFLRAAGFTTVPAPVARDGDARLLLTEWIEGVPVAQHSPQDLDAAIAFMQQVIASSARSDAATFALASEACLSPSWIMSQIEQRRAMLMEDPEIDRFVAASFDPRLAAARSQMEGEILASAELPLHLRRLIPADFGFHNALRTADGRLRFIDFDYFGWDDPVKLAADVTLHPAMTLTQSERRRVSERLAAVLPEDGGFALRLARDRPLYALRWALIVLNPFRRDRAADLPMDAAVRRTLLEARLRIARSLCDQADFGGN